jgi:hypothetical protein
LDETLPIRKFRWKRVGWIWILLGRWMRNGSLLWRKAGFTTSWDEMLPVRFGWNYSEKLRMNLKMWLNVGAYMDGWEAVQYSDGRQVYYLFGRNASN